MTSAVVLDAVLALQNAVDELLKHVDNGGLGLLSDEEFTEVALGVEATRRRLATVDYPLIGEVEARDLPAKELTRSAAGWLSTALRITPGAARARVREAEALGERTALTGEPLAPLRPRIAQARRLGILDAEHVKVMLHAFAELPPSLPAEELDASEQLLVDAAQALHPNDLARVARALVDAADPDGPEPDDTAPDPRRDVTLQVRRDGWGRLAGLLDPGLTAMLDAWLAARSKPRPEDATGRDERTAGQRRHDALTDLLSLALRADEFTAATGSPVTIHVTMTAEQFQNGTGLATTGLGQRIRVSTAFRLAHQGCVAWAVHDSTGSILAHGRGRRLASKEQAEALLVRDGGCAFPGCDIPASWCERHHVWEWLTGGPTDVDNLVLLCRYHHSRFAQQKWRIDMRDGVPWFIPPPIIDPEQKPLRNIRGLRAVPFSGYA
jgi:hypothetical protein